MIREIAYLFVVQFIHSFFGINTKFGFLLLFLLFFMYMQKQDPEPKTTVVDVIPNMIYKSIDFKKCRVGGSYALWKYLKNQDWDPNNIDIFYFTDKFEEFKTYVTKFASDTNGIFTTPATDDKSLIHALFYNNTQNLHTKVVGFSALSIQNIKLEFRIIAIDSRNDDINANGLFLAQICNAPAVVSYTHDSDKGCDDFCVPPKYEIPIQIKRLPYVDQDASQMEKYIERGFEFIK